MSFDSKLRVCCNLAVERSSQEILEIQSHVATFKLRLSELRTSNLNECSDLSVHPLMRYVCKGRVDDQHLQV